MTLRRLAACVSTLVLVLPASLAAQQPEPGESPAQSRGGTYVKLGLAHWQRNIFGGQSLTRWRGNLFGSDFDLTSAALEIETYFDRTHLQLSGWSLGYRKDALALALATCLQRIRAGVWLDINSYLQLFLAD